MVGNTTGTLFRVTTWGESHGEAIGVVIDGCPPRVPLREEDIQHELDRRRPGQSALTTPRDEKDKVAILSGVFEGKTTGAPICLLVRNEDMRPQDYDALKAAKGKVLPEPEDLRFLVRAAVTGKTDPQLDEAERWLDQHFRDRGDGQPHHCRERHGGDGAHPVDVVGDGHRSIHSGDAGVDDDVREIEEPLPGRVSAGDTAKTRGPGDPGT